MIPRLSLLLVPLLWLGGSAFVVVLPPQQHPKSTVLYMGSKVKRGKLARNVEAEALTSRNKSSKRKTTTRRNKQNQQSGSISPDLAKWMASNKGEPSDTPVEAVEARNDNEEATKFTSFETKPKNKSERRTRQSERLAAQEAHSKLVQNYVNRLQKGLNGKVQIADILAIVQELLYNVQSGTMRQISATRNRLDYRLAWVGSDQAICHLGTGLHNKAALARLQEVFLSFPGRNQVEMQEVLRVLGPFPNVKNVLQGTCTHQKLGDDQVSNVKFNWDSVLDGTGKEMTMDPVDLQVYFADPAMIVAVVPCAQRQEDPLADNGKNVLIFVREENLDEKLEELRVA